MTAAIRVAPWALGATVAATLASLATKWLVKKIQSMRYDGLDGLVSFSSNVIAAARALESARPDAFVRDPLAAALAGPTAMARAQARQEEQQREASANQQQRQASANQQQRQASANQQQQEQQQAAAPAARPIPRLIMRTLFIDDLVSWATGGAASSPAAAAGLQELLGGASPEALAVAAPLHASCSSNNGASARGGDAGSGAAGRTAVVMLGAGKDSRPWRLALPPGAVDWYELDMADVVANKCRTLKKARAQLTDTGSSGCTHPLSASSWQCLAADLAAPGWTKVLERAGLRRGQRVVWVAEGLLYYIEPSCVEALIKEAASFSGQGSLFVASIISRPTLDFMHTRMQAAAAPGAATAAQGTATAVRGEALTSRFVWGYTGSEEQYFGSCGWRVLAAPEWGAAAAAWGLMPDKPPTSHPPGVKEVQLLVAELA